MRWIVEFYRSSLGKKQVMAITGALLFGFVLVHMIGNLKVYEGPQVYDAYARGLRTIGIPFVPESGLLWIARSVLLLAVLLHVHAAWSTTQQSHAARTTRYRRRDAVQTTYAERTMRWGGVIIVLFVLYHLAHFTWGLPVAPATFVPHDPYLNFVNGFRIWWVSLIYVVAQVFLAFHLYHGLWSMFQSLGWVPRSLDGTAAGPDWRRAFATTFALVVAIGNISFPIAVLAGVVR
ncbi:MAG TPA: succinate dehydrogenase cytochrome b subunit [Thermoanaerobaculia bacterium]|jgi:succinate dehydrogenase / fumarate reductase cytochrome b subunit|nr:succinate dehydrogenase cytochrome b subunit [Thermoanaerobaculia bacterium]